MLYYWVVITREVIPGIYYAIANYYYCSEMGAERAGGSIQVVVGLGS